ncbi:MAG: calcium-binding protein [Thermoleophilaceae bacterium]
MAARIGAALCLAAVLVAVPATAQGGLPRTYKPEIIDTPDPEGSGAFGWGISSADVTGDGNPELLVAQSNGLPGSVYIWDGVTRELVDLVTAPEKNPPGGGNETFAYVYVETMPDIGSCPQGPTSEANQICNAATIGPGDGIPEIIAGSRNMRVNTANGATPPVAGDPNVGRGYVLDGATRAILKRIDMPQAERATGQGGAQFGRSMMNPSGLAPCDGLRSENNNVGVGACADLPLSERIGDVDGGGKPDIVITSRNYNQPRATAFPGSPCAMSSVTTCSRAGKAWVYSGEAIAGSDPKVILETATQELPNPAATATSGGEYGGNLWPLGDVTGDGLPEFVVPARNLGYPLNNPDNAALQSIGASFMWSTKQRSNGSACANATCMLSTQAAPEPQPRLQFPNNFNHGRAVGDLGATGTPDFLQPSPLQNVTKADEGRVYVFNGDLSAGGGAEQSFQFAQFDDPTPFQGGNFGGGTTGVGDLVQGFDRRANEVLVGGFHFDNFSFEANNTPADLHIMHPSSGANLQTIPHPTGTGGDGFGVGLIPMGDLNDDGFLDFAASSYLANVGVTGAAGRAFIFYSDDSPAPPLPSKPAPEVTTPKVFAAGACANDTLGTAGDDELEGSDAGDRMAGFGGNDIIRSFQDADCLHGGPGDDRLSGGSDRDRLLGARGNDRMNGGTGRDRLFGGDGRDRLVGGFGRDRLYGGNGNDRLRGGGSGDRLVGERGNDRIHAGGADDAANRVDAGPGNDIINVRNRKRDFVLCGRGRDRVIADRGDRLNGCERVSRRRKASRRR